MKIVIATDDAVPVVERLAACFRDRGHDVTVLPKGVWGPVSTEAARLVATGAYDQGVVCCWTGTGASIAANKVPGVRAALCVDGATAAGARTWNDANVLALSLRLLSDAVAAEIVDAWLGATYGGTEDESLACLRSATTKSG
ncbi:MAG: galactose isomerase [Labilithrix sp.]|nr:galactose isomerase [Labilithrix sp.]